VEDGQKIDGAQPGVPFPIPQSGLEAMWNHMVRWEGTHFQYQADSYYVDTRGNPVLSTSAKIAQEYPMYNLDKDYGTDKRSWLYLRSDYTAPSRRAGEIIMVHEPGADYTDGKGRKAWQYLTGQRRVRRAPAIAFDTPSPAVAGAGTYDDSFVYNGSPERYTWKLVGKKEVLAPYNAYKFVFETPVEEALGEKFFKPEYIRWELRRVWVVEATLKEGQRHVYNKRTYYLDEDSWSALAGEMYDGRDNLWRVNYGYMTPLYDVPAGGLIAYSGYDLLKGIYYINTKPVPGTFTNVGEQKSVKFWSPQSMARTGIR